MEKNGISIILASRERFNHLVDTINLFFEMANNKNNIEFIIRCDNDDHVFLKKINELPYFEKLKIIIGERYGGYIDLHKFYNEMASISTGKYIVPINDDLIPLTKGYDEIILSQFTKTPKIFIGNNNYSLDFEGWNFPIIDSRIIKELGYISRCVFYDGYLYFMLKDSGVYEVLPLNFSHLKINDNMTKEKNIVVSEINKNDIKHLDTFKSYMEEDKIKIINLINK